MTDQIIRESLAEKERLRDRVFDADRFGRIETAIAVLQTKFESMLERAVSGDDLKSLKREMEDEVNKQITHICDHLDAKNEQQSEKILSRVESMLTSYQARTTEDRLAQSQALLQANDDTRKEIIRYGIGFALTVLSALVIFWLTRNA